MRNLSLDNDLTQYVQDRIQLESTLRACHDTLHGPVPALGSPRVQDKDKQKGSLYTILDNDSEAGEEDDDDARSGKNTKPYSQAATEREHLSDEDEQSNESDDDGGGGGNWEEVTYEKHTNIEAVSNLKSRAFCDYLSKVYDVYFKGATGKTLNAVITPQSQPYVSVFEACMMLHRLLVGLFDENPVIADPFGGSGLDMAAMIFNLYPKEVFVNDSTWVYDERLLKRDGGVIATNINHMVTLFRELSEGVDGRPPPVIHPPTMKEAHDFIMDLETEMVLHILYLDPCWSLPGEKYEMSSTAMAKYLNSEIFSQLKARNITPRCIVLKTRWGVDHLEDIKKILGKDYSADYCLEATPFRDMVVKPGGGILKEEKGRFRWAVFVHHTLKTVAWHHSAAYDKILRDSKAIVKDRDNSDYAIRVYKRNFIRPNIPLYSERIKPPELVPDGVANDEKRMMTIHMPKLPPGTKGNKKSPPQKPAASKKVGRERGRKKNHV